MALEDLVKSVKKPEIEQAVIDKPAEAKDAIKTIESKGHGKKASKGLWCVEWNRQTRQVFDRGRQPRQGAYYRLKCVRFDGKNIFLALER